LRDESSPGFLSRFQQMQSHGQVKAGGERLKRVFFCGFGGYKFAIDSLDSLVISLKGPNLNLAIEFGWLWLWLDVHTHNPIV